MSNPLRGFAHPPMYGVIVGRVIAILAGGRVTVQFDSLDLSLDCLVLQPYAGDRFGTFLIPEEGSEVLVAFKESDLRAPVVLGCLWYGGDKPPIPGTEDNGPKLLKTKGGHQILLDDSQGAEKIEIVDSSGHNRIVIDTAGDAITIETGGKLNLRASEIEIEAQGNLNLKGLTINLN